MTPNLAKRIGFTLRIEKLCDLRSAMWSAKVKSCAQSIRPRGLFKGGSGRGDTAVRGTMFVRNGAVTPGPSRDCDIIFFVVTIYRTVIPVDTRMALPGVKVPPFK